MTKMPPNYDVAIFLLPPILLPPNAHNTISLFTRRERELKDQGSAHKKKLKIMGRLFIETLSGPRIFKCRYCKVDSASRDDVVSKEFQGRYGRAYLFRNV
ncbi:hypothetical protein Prudu_010694 [Prunus dulcis]|uniref:Yippee domain-containing protein n=1 Tax=Prunus dulcis TaxID=3755 RepID=A0A4Y1R8W3_PRUDU|nr:hypothetical protein Prudu_010694 [Prunus dulcis]